MKTHSRKKQNKSNLCDFESVQVKHLKRYLNAHSDELSNKFNHFDYTPLEANHLNAFCKNIFKIGIALNDDPDANERR